MRYSSGRRHHRHHVRHAASRQSRQGLLTNLVQSLFGDRRSRHHDQAPLVMDAGDYPRQRFSFLSACGWLIAGLAIAWIGWNVVSRTVAMTLAKATPEDAIKWNQGESEALDQLLSQKFADPSISNDALRQIARRALVVNPLDDRALYYLGLVAEREGDKAGAAALMRLAAVRTWRNLPAHLWLFNQAVATRNYRGALPHIDAILRIRPEARPAVLQSLVSFSGSADALQALIEFLGGEDPPWRWDILSRLTAANDRPKLERIFNSLQASAHPPSHGEWADYLQRLIKDGDFSKAYATWKSAFTDQRTQFTLPYNGSFDKALDGSPFNWIIENVPGAEISMVALEGDKRALSLQFSGTRIDLKTPKQLLVLPPGDFHFAGRVKAESLNAPRGLWWRIYCAESKATLGQTPLADKSSPWSDFELVFTVPQQNCSAQWLQLEVPARVDSERMVEGQVWYQTLRIFPASRS